MADPIRVVIPAAGRGSRSGLAIPKALYRIDGVPILVSLLRTMRVYDENPLVIVNPSARVEFERVLEEFSLHAVLVEQERPKGMGDALLQTRVHVPAGADVLLAWGDIPFLQGATIARLVESHHADGNYFSLVTKMVERSYTRVKRAPDNSVVEVLETRELGVSPEAGERDIGLFLFNAQTVFSCLDASCPEAIGSATKEHGFLYVIARLSAQGFRVQGYPIADDLDVLGFNTPEDLLAINQLAASRQKR